MRLCHKCFPVNFAKFVRTPFYRVPPDEYLSQKYFRFLFSPPYEYKFKTVKIKIYKLLLKQLQLKLSCD